MNTLSRSWTLTKITFSVMRADPELLVFPALSAFFSILMWVAFLVPTVFVELMASGDGAISLTFGVIDTILLFCLFFVLSFLSTFFNVCVVHSAKTRFEGGDATFFGSISFALSRLPQIAAWSVVSATVGLILRQLDQLADQKGVLGMVFSVIRGIVGFAWAIVQLFVIPVMVYENVGPFQAIKRSAETLRNTWGESLTKHVGLGIVQFLSMLPVIGVIALGIWALTVWVPLGIGVIAVGFVMLLVSMAVFRVADTIYNTALYHYASTGQSPSGFEDAVLETALIPR